VRPLAGRDPWGDQLRWWDRWRDGTRGVISSAGGTAGGTGPVGWSPSKCEAHISVSVHTFSQMSSAVLKEMHQKLTDRQTDSKLNTPLPGGDDWQSERHHKRLKTTTSYVLVESTEQLLCRLTSWMQQWNQHYNEATVHVTTITARIIIILIIKEYK